MVAGFEVNAALEGWLSGLNAERIEAAWEVMVVTALVIVAGWIVYTLRRTGRTKHNGR